MMMMMMPPLAILTGGRATRLYPVSKAIPKALISVGGKPFINHQLELLKKKGIIRVVICAGYLGEQIREHIGDGSQFGLSVKYSFDGDKLLGTGGALRKALSWLGNLFWVMYGDSYLNTDFKAIYDYFNSFGKNKSGLMTVFKNEHKWDRSNIVYANGEIINYGKKNISREMAYIDYGLAILRKEAVEGIREGEVIDLADVYSRLIEKGAMLGYEIKKRFYEIGSKDGLEETRNYLAKTEKKMKGKQYINAFLSDINKIADLIDRDTIEKAVKILVEIKKNKGRIFILGVGGGAGNASHAVNDFRKIAGMETYAPTDNVSELTARINDEGWDTALVNWLKASRLNKNDCLLIFSVGGGNEDKNISTNLIFALKYAKKVGSKIIGIVGRDGGYTGKVAQAAIIIPPVRSETVTPHTESFQAVIWHLLVSHPMLKSFETKWESTK